MQEFPLKCLDVVQQTLIQLFQTLIHSKKKKKCWVNFGSNMDKLKHLVKCNLKM